MLERHDVGLYGPHCSRLCCHIRAAEKCSHDVLMTLLGSFLQHRPVSPWHCEYRGWHQHPRALRPRSAGRRRPPEKWRVVAAVKGVLVCTSCLKIRHTKRMAFLRSEMERCLLVVPDLRIRDNATEQQFLHDDMMTCYSCDVERAALSPIPQVWVCSSKHRSHGLCTLCRCYVQCRLALRSELDVQVRLLRQP